MVQKYGLRASSNLSDVESRDAAWDNLGFNRSDLAILVNTANAGVSNDDYVNCSGLKYYLEEQVVGVQTRASSINSQMALRATASGDSFGGSLYADTVNNDRAYADASNFIYSTSRNSYFSTTNSAGNYAQGGQYLIGPVRSTTTTASGVNFVGDTKDFSSRFVQYKQYLQVQESPSWNTRFVPTYLAPPDSYASNIFWLDTEYSSFTLDGSNNVSAWDDVLSRGSAVQSSSSLRPSFVTGVLNNKPGVRFDGSNDLLTIADGAITAANEATVVVVAKVLDSDYNILGNVPNSAIRWRSSSDGNGKLGLFVKAAGTSTTPLEDVPTNLPVNGTLIFSFRINKTAGLEFGINKQRFSLFSGASFDFVNSGTFYLGGAPSGGTLNGDVYAVAIFNELLSDENLSSIEEYFAWRFNFVYDPSRFQPIEAELESLGDFLTEDGTPFEIG